MSGEGQVVSYAPVKNQVETYTPVEKQVETKIVDKLVELKQTDMTQADSKADIRRESLQKDLKEKFTESDASLKKLLVEQHVNASKVLSVPGVFLFDGAMETKFIRNLNGEVVGKEFFVNEYYLKDCLSMSQEVIETQKCFTITYNLKISGDLVEKNENISFDIFNWKLFNNKMVDVIIGIILLGSIIAIYALRSRFGYFAIVGLVVGLLDVASGFYFKYSGIEEKLNKAAGGLLKRWVDSLKQFGQIDLKSYNRQEKCVAFIEVVERPMKQQAIQGTISKKPKD
jgi:hypothetical protein